MFVVLAEIEGDVAAAFGTADRDEAHRVFEAAQKADQDAVARTGSDPAAISLTACDDEQSFLKIIREG